MWTTIGQDRAVALLGQSLKAARVAHAYLFVGPTHVGKMTLAKDLAMALNCDSESPPCQRCFSCERIAAGSHSDVQVVSVRKAGEGKATTEIGIEEIRSIQHAAVLPPFEGKNRVVIIEGADSLSVEAANCLLKTLEEPPPNTLFVLLTAKEDLVLPTVVRCQRIGLNPAPTALIESLLERNGEDNQQRRGLLASLARGCPGWALEARKGELFEAYSAAMDDICDAVLGNTEERFGYASKLATEFGPNRESVYDKLGLWLDWWHDALLAKAGQRSNIVNTDRQETLETIANSLSVGQIRACIGEVLSVIQYLKQNANARLALEVFVLSLPDRISGPRVTAKATQ